jgi:ADP-heptose:LPS heptosyltransferase
MVMAWATRAKQRVGFNKEGGYFMLTRSFKKTPNVHRVEEYLSLLENFTGKPIANKQVKLNLADPSAKKNNRVIINFNSEATSRRMPVDKSRSIINTLTHTFTNVTFALVGSPKEGVYIDELLTGLTHPERIENYAGKTSLADLTGLMAGSKAVLTTDSGPAHLANSVGIPTIALFGAGNEHNTAPYNKQNLTVLRYGQLVCEPCVRNTCELYGIPKCMEMLEEFKIINALSPYIDHA